MEAGLVDPRQVVAASPDPFPVYAALRQAGPVHRLADVRAVPGGDGVAARLGGGDSALVCVARDEVLHVLRDTESFTADHLYASPIGKLIGRGWGSDGAEHARVRKLVEHAFRPRALARWKSELIEPLTDSLIDGFVASGQVEFTTAFAMELPIQVISRILGLEASEYPGFRSASFDILEVVTDPEGAQRAKDWITERVAAVIEDRRATPRDDLISDLVTVEVDGQRLSNEDVFEAVVMLIVAGNDTTFRALGTAMLAFLSNPDQLGHVRADEALLLPAIEEVLRWDPPAHFDSRVARRPSTLGGHQVEPGDLVLVCLASANRDEKYCDDPESFDVARSVKHPHVSFAAGVKFCLGAHLARMELDVALRALLRRLRNATLDSTADPAPGMTGLGMRLRGPNHLPIVFEPGVPSAG